ncbi:sulfatase [Postechiella marina]|uniref:Sulfatase n=1 Tax=Postechiella marina TaxID=943941 RepID=A0ABP8CDH7_9FLAO
MHSCQTKKTVKKEVEKRPNILFCIVDDQSFIHTSINGTAEVNTPNFDRIAKSGVLFNNAYCNASSCAPSRASILTGRNIWEIEEGGLLFGGLPKQFSTFSSLLKKSGYETGYTGKGYMPASHKEPYQKQPLAEELNAVKLNAPKYINRKDYSGNFNVFMEKRVKDKPFFFWYGSHEAHRAYNSGDGIKAGKDISKIKVPGFLPDNDLIRSDIADYYNEIEWSDAHLGRMLQALEHAGELENTIVIVTADNGMPFPRAKGTCYDYGTHMPLAVCWGNKLKGGNNVNDFISFIDFAPTILEAAGITIPKGITGKSFLNVLLSNKSGLVDKSRDKVFTALERHAYCRQEGLTYPIRTIRKGDWLYIMNFEPDRWPAGDPDFYSPHQGFYGDIDKSPSRTYILDKEDKTAADYYFNITVGKRPDVELYNVKEDPYQLNNVAFKEINKSLCKELKNELFTYLSKTNDPRMMGKAPWDNYPYYFDGFSQKHLLPIGKRDNKNK